MAAEGGSSSSQFGSGGRGLTPMRVTMLGGPQVGKTSLVTAFVNNFCPTVYSTTDDLTLYYKTLEIPDKSQKGAPFPILAEIEDTYAWGRNDGLDSFKRRRDASLLRTPTGGAAPKTPKKSPSSKNANSQANGGEPFEMYPAPDMTKFVPITHRRMGFLVLFDAAEEHTLEQAQDCIDGFEPHHNPNDRPIIYLVASKMDRGLDKHSSMTYERAQQFARERDIQFAEVSSVELQKVRKLFRKLLTDVQARPNIWKKDMTAGGVSAAKRVSNLASGVASALTPSSTKGGNSTPREQAEDGARPTKKQDCNLQ